MEPHLNRYMYIYFLRKLDVDPELPSTVCRQFIQVTPHLISDDYWAPSNL